MKEASGKSQSEPILPVFNEGRISALSNEEKNEEIRRLLDKTKREGVTPEELEGLKASLQRHYRNPERYRRFPTLEDMRIKSRPLPYRSDEVIEE